MTLPAERALIIDDEDDSRHATALVFESRGWTVETAHDLRSGIDAAMRQQPDVIVTELLLPDVKSLQFARSLRSAVDHDIQVVALSRAPLEALAEARREGFDLVLGKPLDTTDLDSHFKRTTRLPRLRP